MASWDDFTTAAPDLAARVGARFGETGLGLLATLRRDGAPRISGIEPLLALGELWLGSMPGSRKSADLRRDPRFALHSATVDKEVRAGDAKVVGRALEVVDPAVQVRVATAFADATGTPPPEVFDLFRAEVTEAVLLRPGVDHLVVEHWAEGQPIRRIERR